MYSDCHEVLYTVPAISAHCRLTILWVQAVSNKMEDEACRLAAHLMVKAAVQKAVLKDNNVQQVTVGVTSPCLHSHKILSA